MTGLPRIGGPADSALEQAGHLTLESLAGASTKELLALHGLGPKGVRLLDEALREAGLEPLRRP